MRRTVMAGLLACTLSLLLGTAQASAAENDANQVNSSGMTIAMLLSDTTEKKVAVTELSEEVTPTETQTPKEVIYTVEKGDSLDKIAKKHSTTWRRLYDKNVEIENPDIIYVGLSIVIPGEDEELAERALPVVAEPQPVVVPTPTPQPSSAQRVAAPKPAATAPTPAPAPRGSSSGNLYSYGYCTWYVKNRRPDLPNNLGNAYTWYSRAAAQGMAVGSTPSVGAVAQKSNHVAYVEAVHGNGTMTISEYNYRSWNTYGTRVVETSSWRFIY